MPGINLKQISGLDLDDVPMACDSNFYNLDMRMVKMEAEMSYFKDICTETKQELGIIHKLIEDLTNCVKPRLAEFGARIGHLEADETELKADGKELKKSSSLDILSKRNVILIILVAAVASAGFDRAIAYLLNMAGVK